MNNQQERRDKCADGEHEGDNVFWSLEQFDNIIDGGYAKTIAEMVADDTVIHTKYLDDDKRDEPMLYIRRCRHCKCLYSATQRDGNG